MVKEYALEGVRTWDINLLPDERGFFAEALRLDWSPFVEDQIVQANMSYSFPGVVRAWHKHLKGQVDYFITLQGTIKICAFDENTGKLAEVISTSRKPTLTRIPGKYLHGFRNVGDESCLLLYFVNKLYDYNNPDEIRVEWNDNKIVPSEINGNKKDARVNKPWDWLYVPYK
jgi:dTDP-4-dehydrorhamnose 3,5-epimerase